MKELEIHDTPTEWQTARLAYEWMQGFHFHQTGVSKRLRFPSNTTEDPTDLDEKVLLTDKCTIPGFQSIIVHGRTQNTMMMGHCLNVMTQVPYPDNKADLPNGVYIMRMYTELKDGSQSVAIVLWNLTARPIHLARGRVIGQVFSLEPNEIGCMDATELLKDEPFKERFRHIAPPLVDEVCQHIQEMMEGSDIRPSQLPWCNAVVLVRKKYRSLRFCIDFHRLNSRTKKDTYPLPRIQETMESMVGTRHFSCIDLKSGF